MLSLTDYTTHTTVLFVIYDITVVPWKRAMRMWSGVLMSCGVLQGSRKDSLLTSLEGPDSAGSKRLDGSRSNSVRWM